MRRTHRPAAGYLASSCDEVLTATNAGNHHSESCSFLQASFRTGTQSNKLDRPGIEGASESTSLASLLALNLLLLMVGSTTCDGF